MSRSVWVLCPNGHRVSVSITPGTLLNAIKQQACEKQGFQPNQYGLRKEDQKKSLDLSLPFRLSGLTNKAKLELVEEVQQVAVLVNIALQLEGGERCQGQVLNSLSLSRAISSIAGEGVSASHILYLQRRIEATQFSSLTLADLGVLWGGAALRLYGVRGEMRESKRHTIKEEKERMDVTEATQSEESESVSEPTLDQDIEEMKRVERGPLLFRPDPSTPEPMVEEESDEFFEVTETDIRKMLCDIHKITQRQLKFQKKTTEVKHPDTIVIRIRFPDGCQLQDVFRPASQTTDELYSFVQDYLSSPPSQLTLYQAPPKVVIQRGGLLADAGLTSTTLLHAGGGITLRDSLVVENGTAAAMRQLSEVLGTPTPPPKTATVVEEKALVKPTTEEGGEKKAMGKPKWFKM